MKKITLFIIMALFAPVAFAYNFSVTTPSNHTIYINVSGTEATVTYQSTSASGNYQNQSGDLVIPSTVENGGTTYTVTAIGPNAFKNTHFSTITIPATVSSIGNNAFRSSDLTSIVFPDAVTSLPTYVCAYCTSLVSVTLGSAVTSIGSNAFSGCSSLATVNLPSSLTTISGSAFNGCSLLEPLTIPSSVASIGYNAFFGVKMLFYNGSATGAPWGAGYINGFVDGNIYYASATRDTLVGIHASLTTFTIPSTVTTILGNALNSCFNLTAITIPQQIVYIGNAAFANCTALTTVNYNADSCVYMGNGNYPVFGGCSNMTTLNIGSNVRYIPSNAFNGCTGLTSVVLPSSLGVIGDNAFKNCTSLTTVNLPSSVYWILGQPFYGCTSIAAPIYNDWIMVMLPSSWQGAYVIPNGIHTIADYAFNNCAGLTSVTLPSSLTTVDDRAFVECVNLDTINILAQNPPVFYPSGDARQAFIENVAGGISHTDFSRHIVNVPCGSQGLYKSSPWNCFVNIKSPCSVFLTVLPSEDSIVLVDGINVGGRQHNSSGWYEVGDTALLAAERFTWSDGTLTLNKYGQFFGWSNGTTGWQSSHVVSGPDTVYALCGMIAHNGIFANNINTGFISVYGNIGYDGNMSECEVYYEDASGEGHLSHAIYQTALWVGNRTNMAAVRFLNDGFDYFPGPLRVADAQTDMNTVMRFNRVWRISRDMIDYHIAHCGETGYIPADDIATWPGNGPDGYAEQLAPFYDADSNGIYNALAGDYPLIRGDECTFSIFNDAYMTHSETGGAPLGIEVHCMTYSFTEPDSAMNYTLFSHFDIYNRSANTYDSVYLGAFTDFDIGNANDDYVGCDVQRDMYYGYNGAGLDLSGAGSFVGVPPAQSCTFLGGAQTATGDRLGMTNFTYYLNAVTGRNAEPSSLSDYYNYMRSYWRDGTHVKFGNMGLDGTINCTHMFPWDSDSALVSTGGVDPGYLWSEFLMPNNPPDDRRGVGSSGPFNFTAGGTQQLDLAYTTAWGSDNIESIRALGTATDDVRRQWLRDTTDTGRPFTYMPYSAPHAVGIDDVAGTTLRVYPNPATKMLYVSGVSESNTIQLFDISGRNVMTVPVNAGTATLDLAPLPQGIYILRADGAVRRIIKR